MKLLLRYEASLPVLFWLALLTDLQLLIPTPPLRVYFVIAPFFYTPSKLSGLFLHPLSPPLNLELWQNGPMLGVLGNRRFLMGMVVWITTYPGI